MVSTSKFLLILTIAATQLPSGAATSQISPVRTKRHCPCVQFNPSSCSCQPGFRPFCTCVRPTVRYPCACSPPAPPASSCYSSCQRTCLDVCANSNFGPSCPISCSSSCAQSCMHQLGITSVQVPMPHLIAMSRQCLPDCQRSCQDSCTSRHPSAFCAPLCRAPCERKCSQLVPVPAVRCVPNCVPSCSPQCLQRLYIEVELSAASQLWQPSRAAASASASADFASIGQEKTQQSTQSPSSTDTSDADLEQPSDQQESSSDTVDKEEFQYTTVTYPTLIQEIPEESATEETIVETTEPFESGDHQEAPHIEAGDSDQSEIDQLSPTDTTIPEEDSSTNLPGFYDTVLQDIVDPSETTTEATDSDSQNEITQEEPRLDQQNDAEEAKSELSKSEVISQNQTVAVNIPISIPTLNHCTAPCMPKCESTCILVQILLNYQSDNQLTIADVIHNFNQTLSVKREFPGQKSSSTTIPEKRSFDAAPTKADEVSSH